MNHRQALILCLALGATLLAGCNQGTGGQTSAAGATPADDSARAAQIAPPRPVRFMKVALSQLDDVSILPGEVRPRFEQRYGFRVGGKIARRLVDVGQTVQAGQELAVLDSQDIEPAINAQAAQVQVARSDFKLQQSELKRQQDLRDQGFVSAAALERQAAATDAADSRLKAAQAQLANVRNGLNFQSLRADTAGVVIGIDAESGSVVAAGQSVVRVAQLGEKEIAVNVPEHAVGLMKKATGFAVSIDALGDRSYAAKLRELSPAADPASRTYSARLSIVGADDALKLGMSASVRLTLGAASAIVVPNSALYTRDNTTHVWLVDSATETVRSVAVTLGQSTSDGVTIVSGLKPGDLVVTAGANLLMAGQKVRLLGAASSSAAGAGQS